MPDLLEERNTDESHSKQAANIFSSAAGQSGSSAELPKGVVLDKNGKPCRTCTSSAAWMAMMKGSTKPSATSNTQSTTTTTTSQPVRPATETYTPLQSDSQPASDCPPDVEELGRSSWTLLHSLTASYPPAPEPSYQRKTRSFLSLFSQLYPCWVCAEDFQTWMAEPENDVEQALKSQEEFGQWMCRAHNAVNVKLGKKEFDCNLWKQRWRDGWKDGRCD